MYLVDSFYNQKDSEFIDIITTDLKQFSKNLKLNKLLLLPPIDNYHRYLTHQIIQEIFHNLNSFSIGDKDQRRLFICSKELHIRNNVIKEYETNKRMSSVANKEENNINENLPQTITTPTTTIQNQETKKKRPTKEVYVPRGRRNLVEPNGNKESNKLNKSDTAPLSSLNLSSTETQSTELLTDPSIVGYLKHSPEKAQDDLLDKQMKLLNLNENNKENVDNFVNNNNNKPSNDDALDSWDSLYDDEGECTNKKLISELNSVIEDKVDVDIERLEPINYLKWLPKDVEIEDSELPHVIEIYDFPAQFKNEDIINSLRTSLGHTNFDLKWVDDTHCLGVFSNTNAAIEALKLNHALIKVRPISKATQASKKKAQRSTEYLKPYKQRPQTTNFVACKLIGASLGINNLLTSEKAKEEKLKLKNARDKRRQEKEQNEAVWNGKV